MKAQRIQLWLGLVAISCGGTEYVDFQEQKIGREPPSDSPPSSDEGTGGTLLGAGGEGVSPLRRGGYAGGFLTVMGMAEGDDFGSDDPACSELGGIGLFAYDIATCRAGSICAMPCVTDAGCYGHGVDAAGEPFVVSGVCRPTLGQLRCQYPCEVDADCPGQTICDETGSGRFCLVPDIPYAPGCTESFCLHEGSQYSVYGDPYYCDAETPCCDGLSCSPSGECQNRACLAAFWECLDAPVGCCDGLSCRDGYCQPE